MHEDMKQKGEAKNITENNMFHMICRWLSFIHQMHCLTPFKDPECQPPFLAELNGGDREQIKASQQ